MNREDINHHIGKRLRWERRRREVTMKQLAAHCGVTFQQIHKYEAGKVAISAGMLWALAEALSIGVGDLFPNTPPALADSSVAPQDPLPVDLRRARATRRGD